MYTGKTQIWIAVSVYVLVAIVRKRLNLDASLYTSMQVFSMAVFQKVPIESVFLRTHYSCDTVIENNQLNLSGYRPDGSGRRYIIPLLSSNAASSASCW